MGEDEPAADAALERRARVLADEGRRPYVIHSAPGHPPLGGLGYVLAAEEVTAQDRALGVGFDAVVCASGSALTHAGVLVGLLPRRWARRRPATGRPGREGGGRAGWPDRASGGVRRVGAVDDAAFQDLDDFARLHGEPALFCSTSFGHREIIVWDAATARLLPRYLAGRRQGPLFVTTGLPNIVPAELDRSPEGRGRLSYQRAWSLFREASGGQWTLHQLRHSALTHLGEDGVSAPLLMAKSRHRNLRTLSRYVRPGTKAVAQLTAEHDPARRGKHPRR